MERKFKIKEKVWVLQNGIAVETSISRIDEYVTADNGNVAVYYFTDFSPTETLEATELFHTKEEAERSVVTTRNYIRASVWIARDIMSLRIFNKKPERNENGIWVVEDGTGSVIDKNFYPEVKTTDKEPTEFVAFINVSKK